MFPLKAQVRLKRIPFVTWLLLAANFAVFFYQVQLGPQIENFIQEYSLIPRRLWLLQNPNNFPYLYPLRTLITSAFLHGGWLHLFGNMLMLWVFGPPVEDRQGHGRFLVFYLACGVMSGLGHAAFLPQSEIPCVGASGAIAGVMGAGLLLFPRAGVWAIVPFFVILRLVRVPAFIFLLFWFAGQVWMAHRAQQQPGVHGQIAVMAHIAGFIAGVVLAFWNRKPRS